MISIGAIANSSLSFIDGIITHDIIERGNEQGSSVSVRLPSNKVVPRRGSSRDLLRGAVTRRQSSKDLRNVLMKRQSSRDMVNGGPKNVTKDPRICLIKRQSSQDLCNDRFTIRRDSINGLRIVSRESESESESDTIQRLGDINISDDKREFTKFQLESLRTHNQYRSKHRAPAMALDAELCKRSLRAKNLLFRKIVCTFPILFEILSILDHPSRCQGGGVRRFPRQDRHLRAQRGRGKRREPLLELEQRPQVRRKIRALNI